MKPTHYIRVTRIGTDDPPLEEFAFTGTDLQAERKASDVWSGGANKAFIYSNQPGRFRLEVFRLDLMQTID